MLEDKIKGKNKNMQVVANYLLDKAKKDPGYSKILEETEREFSDCEKYIYEEARKLAVSGCAMVEDSTVYGWADTFYTMSDDDFKKLMDRIKPKPKKKEKAEDADNKAKKALETDKTIKTQETEQKELESPDNVSQSADNVKKEHESKEKSQECVKTEHTRKKKKNADEETMSGQLDIFSFLGGDEA